MSTPNFYNQKNFKLFIQSFEAMSMEDFEIEYGSEYDYYSQMQLENDLFYEEIVEGYDGFKKIMEDFNDTLIFHELEFRSGHYDGIQLYVEEKENPHELDNEDCHYYFDMCRSKAIRKYDSEVRKINKWMDEVASQYGWKELICGGIFSNGEAIYYYAENLRNKVKQKA